MAYRFRCVSCRKNKDRTAFSNNQLKKNKQQRTCKACIGKQQGHAMPPKKFKQESKEMEENQESTDSYIESIRLEGLRLAEPGQMSWCNKLHEHCIGKKWFTELHLQIHINPREAFAAQSGLQRIFKFFPETFVYRNIVIVASEDRDKHLSIVSGIKHSIPLSFDDSKMRLCVQSLPFQDGLVSDTGLTFYDASNTRDEFDLSVLLASPLRSRRATQHKKEFMHSSTGKECAKSVDANNALNALQQNQQRMKAELKKLKHEMCSKQTRMTAIESEHVLVKWQTLKQVLLKHGDIMFDEEKVEKFKALMWTALAVRVSIELKDGYHRHIMLTVKDRTEEIRNNTPSRELLHKLEQIIDWLAQQIKDAWQLQHQEEKMAHQDVNNANAVDEYDAMSALIETLKLDLVHHQRRIDAAELELDECAKQINDLLRKMVREMQFQHNVELCNTQFFPTKLVLAFAGKNERLFNRLVLQHQAQIMQWISHNMSNYEGLADYGSEHLFLRFMIKVVQYVTFWVAALRYLTLPVSIANLNEFYNNVSHALHVEFIPKQRMFGTDIDIVMVVTYIMGYKSLNMSYTSSKTDRLKTHLIGSESEKEIVKFFNDCFEFVIGLMPNYKSTTTAQTVSKQIDIYMNKNATI